MTKKSMAVFGKKYMNNNLIYEILSPGGNTTALVEGLVNDLNRRKIINDQIMRENPDVEQVGFYDLSDIKRPKLQMAGNELCVNAIRALAYLACLKSGGRIKEFDIEIILGDCNLPFKAGVDGLRQSWVKINPANIQISECDIGWVVPLEGLTQVITLTSVEQPIDPEKIKSQAFEILRQLNLLNTVPAAGVTFVTKNQTGLSILPVVWVRAIKTLFLETACGSATIAAYLALANGKTICQIQQPSGITLQVEQCGISGDNRSILKISGPVNRIKNK